MTNENQNLPEKPGAPIGLPPVICSTLGMVQCPYCAKESFPGASREDQDRTCETCGHPFFYWARWEKILSLDPFAVEKRYISEKRL